MRTRLVGRAAELTELTACLDDALHGRPGVVLLAGEPGIGKTRLATELARTASDRGAEVLWGRCSPDEGAPAYWPWRGALSGPAAVPVPQQLLGDPGPSPGDSRFALFDAVSRHLRDLAADAGLLLVLDDLQWADPASLALLAHVARETVTGRLLLAGTYRTAEIAADPARAGVVADLARHPGAVTVELRGLDGPAIAQALAERLGTAAPDDLVPVVARRTGGNPFFVGEIARTLAEDPDAGVAGRVPLAVRDAVRVRLDRLPPSCREALQVVATLGAEPEPEVLAAVLAQPAPGAGPSAPTLDDLGPAVGDGLVEFPDGRPLFVHDLVRETVLDEVGPARRARLHGRALELLVGPDPAAVPDDPHVLVEIARHALGALPDGDRAAAVGWARRAGDAELGRLAYEDAARWYARAADAGRGVLRAGEQARLLVAAGRASGLAHDIVLARERCTEAVALARHAGDAEALSDAALALPAVSELEWLDASRTWLTEALHELPDEDSPRRARLLAQLAHCILLRPDPPELERVSAAALAMAERVDEPESLADALRARQLARSGPDGNAERLVLGARMLALAQRTGDPEQALWGHLWTFDALLQAGRVPDAVRELSRVEPLVERLRRPMVRLHLLRSRMAVEFGRGRFAEADAINAETVEIAARGRHKGMEMTGRSLALGLAAMTGRDVDGSWLDIPTEEFIRPFTALGRGWIGLWHLTHGRTDEARNWYDGMPTPGSPAVPAFLTLVVDALHVQLATDLGDAATAAECYRVLAPYADLHVTGGAGAVTTSGSMQLFLGIGALGAGRTDTAVRHLRRAVAENDRAGLPPFSALARYRLATALRSRGNAEDADEAVALAAEAAATAQRLGMAPLQRLASTAAADRGHPLLTPRESEVAELVGRGLTNRQIAAHAHISERTVETHVARVLAKLGFTARSQIAAWVARRAGPQVAWSPPGRAARRAE